MEAQTGVRTIGELLITLVIFMTAMYMRYIILGASLGAKMACVNALCYCKASAPLTC